MRYLLIMLWIGGLLLGLGQAVRAQTPSEKQMTEMHTVRIAAQAPVFVSVMLDGRLVLNATLQPGEWRTWHGEQFELKASNASALEVTLDGTDRLGPPVVGLGAQLQALGQGAGKNRLGRKHRERRNLVGLVSGLAEEEVLIACLEFRPFQCSPARRLTAEGRYHSQRS